jgi:hypothetical protein
MTHTRLRSTRRPLPDGYNDPKHLREALSRGAQGSTNVASQLIADVLKSIGVH